MEMRRLKLHLPELVEQYEQDRGMDKLTQKELADALGIPVSTLSRYMRGYLNRYDGEILEKLCDFFQCEIQDLLRLERSA